MLWTAQTLVEQDSENEHEIIPTMVFGALAVEEPLLEELKRSLGMVEWKSRRRRVLTQRFSQTFKPYGIWTVAGDVPIIRRDPIHIHAIHDRKREVVKKVTIDVVDISVRPELLAEDYRKALQLFGLTVGYSDEGELGWQVDPGVIHMEVYPSLVDPSIDAITRSIQREPRDNQAFSQPLLVGEMYAVLRGSNAKGRFRGFGRSALPGNLTNKPEAKTLIPTCVAWYLADREKYIDYSAKLRTARILNRHLLGPCGKEDILEGSSEFIQLWANVGKRAATLETAEQVFLHEIRGSQFAPDYFAPSDNK